MNVICLDEEAFFALVERVVERIQVKDRRTLDKWVGPEEAMRLLRITSKSTLQKLRDNGHIRFSHPFPKHILYDTDSILNYLEKHAKDTF